MLAQVYPVVEQLADWRDAAMQRAYAKAMRIWTLLAALCALIASPLAADPRVVETMLDNGAGRLVPITLVVPQGRLRGIIAFSHGALSSPAKYAALTTRWAEAGYFVVAPLHGDSTDWTGAKPAQAQQMPWRLADMALVRARLGELARLARLRLGRAPLHAAGHSFGGLIAIAWDEPAIASVIAISPPGPIPTLPMPPKATPLLVVTGTKDSNPISRPDGKTI